MRKPNDKMYKVEKDLIDSKSVNVGSSATMTEVSLFENQYGIEFPTEIRQFYLELNGYTNEGDMVNFYRLEDLRKTYESCLNLPPIDVIDDFFVLGDFGFQASFWLLEILGDSYKLYVLNLGTVKLIEMTLSFKSFFSRLLDDPYTVLEIEI